MASFGAILDVESKSFLIQYIQPLQSLTSWCKFLTCFLYKRVNTLFLWTLIKGWCFRSLIGLLGKTRKKGKFTIKKNSIKCSTLLFWEKFSFKKKILLLRKKIYTISHKNLPKDQEINFEKRELNLQWI